MTGDRIEIVVVRGDETVIMADRLPAVAYFTKGELSTLGWLEPAAVSLIRQVAGAMTRQDKRVYEEGNG